MSELSSFQYFRYNYLLLFFNSQNHRILKQRIYWSVMTKLVRLDADWVPPFETGASLYIRPTYIGTEAALGVHSSKDAILYIICGPAGQLLRQISQTGLTFSWSTICKSLAGRGGWQKRWAQIMVQRLHCNKWQKKWGFNQMLWLFGPGTPDHWSRSHECLHIYNQRKGWKRADQLLRSKMVLFFRE